MSARTALPFRSPALLLAAALDGGGARAEEPPAAAVPTLEHVILSASGRRYAGWPLDPLAEGGCAFLSDEGVVVLVPRDPPPEIHDVVARPVTEVPPAALVAALSHAERGVRDRCEDLLREQGALALPHYGAALDGKSPEACRLALSLLAQQAAAFPKASGAWLTTVRSRLLDASDEMVRKMALRAYAALGADDAFSRCTDSLRLDPSVQVRHEAIVLLGRTKDLHAVDPLLDHLARCEERSLRLVTFDALRRLTGRSFARDEARWRSWWTNHRAELLAAAAR